MSIYNLFIELFTDTTLLTITIGTMVLGATSGMLGSFAVLRKESLLGDAISHAALPGIVLAFLITGSKESYVLLFGALIVGLIGTIWIRSIIHKTHLKTDTALGLILSIFFGFGMLLLTYVQKLPNANQAGLDKYLFGQAATLINQDVYILIGITVVAIIVLFLFWKEFKIMLFDSNYAKTLGFNVKFIDILISFFIVLTIVLGLQTVGVVLMSALLLAPAAAARQWTNSLGKMVLIAAFIGALSGLIGTGISASEDNLPTGPVIVMVASTLVLFSFIFSPTRGILFRQIRLYQNRNNLELMKTLQLMYNIAKTHENFSHPHAIGILNNFHGFTKTSLKKMEERKWIQITGNQWHLTATGFKEAKEMFHSNTLKNE
jgi:manganese/zinc/iron transport system permease protein